MKKISISDKCNQCGICVMKCPEIFSENDQGDIVVVADSVPESDSLLSAKDNCPVKAIDISDGEDKTAVLNKYISELEKMKKGLSVSTKDIEFGPAYTRQVLVPNAGSSSYEYRSSRAAERAGLEAFRSRCYSQIDKLILERITDYRVTVIKPYYSKDENSAYTKFNKKVEDILKAVTTILGKDKFSADFCKVNVYPDSSDTTWRMLEKGQLISDEQISVVKREYSYSLSDYESYIDYDDMEDYRGKDMYNYTAFEASTELGKDLGNALGWAKSNIEENSLNIIKWLIDMYNKSLMSCVEDKIKKIKAVMASS